MEEKRLRREGFGREERSRRGRRAKTRRKEDIRIFKKLQVI